MGQLWDGLVRVVMKVLSAPSLALLYSLFRSSMTLDFVVALGTAHGANNLPTPRRSPTGGGGADSLERHVSSVNVVRANEPSATRGGPSGGEVDCRFWRLCRVQQRDSMLLMDETRDKATASKCAGERSGGES